MKENKKVLLDKVEKLLKKGSKLESKVLNLALQKLDTGDYVIEENFVYTANHKRLIYVLGDNAAITIPEGVEVVGDKAASQKKNLTTLTLPSTLRKIGRDAFSDCDKLTSVVIPAAVEQIDAYAFADCDSLKSVYFESVPKELSRKVFDDCENLHEISVPADGVKAIRKVLHMGDEDSEDIVSGREKPQEKNDNVKKTKKVAKKPAGEPKPKKKP